jgi:hypothetical protein
MPTSLFCAAGLTKPNECGNHLLLQLAAKLRYFELDWGFSIPWGHACLLGCVKGLFKELFSPFTSEAARPAHEISHARRRIITSRASRVSVTHEVGRPYKDVVHCWKSYTIEDWLHFTKTYSVFVLHNMLHPEIAAAWGHLRAAVLHYMRLREDTLEPAVREAAREHLRKYAKAVETYLPVHLCTFNLHLIVCHSYKQKTQTGTIFELLEFWIERGVGDGKEVVKYRLTSGPEKVVVGHHLLKRRLEELDRRPNMQNLPKKYFPRRGQHVMVDEAPANVNSFIGTGELTLLDAPAGNGMSDADAIYRCLNQYTIHFFLRNIEAWRYQNAWIGGEVVQSLVYRRARSRVSYNVRVDWVKGSITGTREVRFGMVHYLVKLLQTD